MPILRTVALLGFGLVSLLAPSVSAQGSGEVAIFYKQEVPHCQGAPMTHPITGLDQYEPIRVQNNGCIGIRPFLCARPRCLDSQRWEVDLHFMNRIDQTQPCECDEPRKYSTLTGVDSDSCGEFYDGQMFDFGLQVDCSNIV